MRYRELSIQTQRETPSNARSRGFALLVRAGYLTHGNLPTRLGEHALRNLQARLQDPAFLYNLDLPVIQSETETFLPLESGPNELAYCRACAYTDRLEVARFAKTPTSEEPALPMEKVQTPDANTIESLAGFLGVPKEKTAKALMYARVPDGRFVFVVVRGDMQLSEAKLRAQVGEVRPAKPDEIGDAGAVVGYASPIGLRNALIAVDDLIPRSANLVAGANEAGHHFRNTNYGRDYTADIVADLVGARLGDPCPNCGNGLDVLSGIGLATRNEYDLKNVLLALAETHHDERGLTLSPPIAPFDVYLMNIPGREMDTRSEVEKLHESLKGAGITVLLDDREERAGVKFNDADLIGLPIRITVGEKALRDGMVELKARTSDANQRVRIDELIETVRALLN